MSKDSLSAGLAALAAAGAESGPRGVMRASLRLIMQAVRRPYRVFANWTFDRRHGVDTGGRRWLDARVRAGAAHADGVDFEATTPREWRRMIGALGIRRPSEFAFLDLGCGKGVTLVLAAKAGFGRVIGVELDGILVEAARRNVTRPGSEHVEAEVVHGDAGSYRFPSEPTVLYLYNPFGLETMCDVARRLQESLIQSPRPLYVVYLNPVHRAVWDQVSGIRTVRRSRRWVAYQVSGLTAVQKPTASRRRTR